MPRNLTESNHWLLWFLLLMAWVVFSVFGPLSSSLALILLLPYGFATWFTAS